VRGLTCIFALWQLGVIVLFCTKWEFSTTIQVFLLNLVMAGAYLICWAAIFVVGLVRPENFVAVKHLDERR
jgi:hypothetical protein